MEIPFKMVATVIFKKWVIQTDLKFGVVAETDTQHIIWTLIEWDICLFFLTINYLESMLLLLAKYQDFIETIKMYSLEVHLQLTFGVGYI